MLNDSGEGAQYSRNDCSIQAVEVRNLARNTHIALLQTRDEVKLSQEEMAHRLAMATRSYIDLENGTSCCSAVTFILFLLYVCPNPTAFLDKLRQAMEAGSEAA